MLSLSVQKLAMRLINISSGEKYIKWIVTVIVNNS